MHQTRPAFNMNMHVLLSAYTTDPVATCYWQQNSFNSFWKFNFSYDTLLIILITLPPAWVGKPCSPMTVILAALWHTASSLDLDNSRQEPEAITATR